MVIEFVDGWDSQSGGDLYGSQRVVADGRKLPYAELFTLCKWAQPIREWLFIHLKHREGKDFHGLEYTDISEDGWLTIQVPVEDSETGYEDAVRFYLEHEDDIIRINEG